MNILNPFKSVLPWMNKSAEDWRWKAWLHQASDFLVDVITSHHHAVRAQDLCNKGRLGRLRWWDSTNPCWPLNTAVGFPWVTRVQLEIQLKHETIKTRIPFSRALHDEACQRSTQKCSAADVPTMFRQWCNCEQSVFHNTPPPLPLKNRHCSLHNQPP